MKWTEVEHIPAQGPVAMQQHDAYAKTCSALGSRTCSYLLGPPDGPIGTAQVLIRRWPAFGDFALLARGPVWHEGVSQAQARLGARLLVSKLKSQFTGVIFTTECLGSRDPLADEGLLPLFTAGTQARLSLHGSVDERMARQHGKWRNRLRRAFDAPLVVKNMPLPPEPDHWLLIREELQSKRRRYRRLPARFTHAWAVTNGPGSTRLFTAEQNGEPVAAMLFLLHGRSASYHIGWSGSEGRDAGAHNRLLWEASNWLAAKGYAWVDLGTLDTETTPGLARFKLGSGAKPLPLGSTWLEAPGARTVARLFARRPRSQSQNAHHPNAPGEVP